MPRIDPSQLLKCLTVLLSSSGGIKSKNEVERLASLMTKFSKKLVSKCIYVLILKSTEADLLDMFMSAGGWNLTYNWLSDGIESKNWPLVAELVELLLLCPADIERLKGNNCPKLIKVLSKDPAATPKVHTLACSVVDLWLAVVKGACEASGDSPVAGTSSDSSVPSLEENGVTPAEDAAASGVYKITIRSGKNVLAQVISSDKTSPRIEEVVDDSKNVEEEDIKHETHDEAKQELIQNEGDVTPPKEEIHTKRTSIDEKKTNLKRRSGGKRSPEPDKKIVSKEKRKFVPEKKGRFDLKLKSKDRKMFKEKALASKGLEEKEKLDIMKLITPSIGKIGKIPKKSKDDKKSDKPPAEPKKPPPKDPKKYNISIETRKGGEERPKTVKTFNSKFRSTGLEEVPPPPKPAKKKEEIEKKTLKRTSPTKDVPVPEKKLKEEEKLPVTPPKPKVSGLQESNFFADALTAANTQKDTKKRKRRPSAGSSPDVKKEYSPTPIKTEDKESKESIKPFKFYQDTLLTKEEVKSEIKNEDTTLSEEKAERLEISDETEPDEISKEELEDEVAKAEEAIDQVLKLEEKKNVEREKNRLPKGVLVYVKKSKTIKKNVKWKPDKDLESVQFFELDETERVNVTKTFVDMKQMERTNERILLSRKLVSEDVMEEKTPWRSLKEVEIAGDLVVPGRSSVEKEIQRARERTSMQAIYFNRSLIPDSPAEPDLEIHAYTEPAIIPLKDQTGNVDSVISYKDKSWPESKGYAPGISGDSPPRAVMDMIDMPHPLQQSIPPAMYQQYPQQASMHPYMPQNMMQQPEWMGPIEGNNMMVGSGQGNEPMMMPGMNPGMHPGLLPTPDMFHMGPHPHQPEYMGPPFGPMGPPQPGMFPGNFQPNPHHQEPSPRHQRPWFRGQNSNNMGNNSGSGGTWRHPSKGGWTVNNKMCKYYLKKGHCRTVNCNFRHGSAKSNIR